jgi:CheY-like chemotaxis protein
MMIHTKLQKAVKNSKILETHGTKSARKILLIDDEPGILRVTAIALRDEGYMVETAQNGRAGLAACARFSPHVVITDIHMPEMDGISLLKEIKKAFILVFRKKSNAYSNRHDFKQLQKKIFTSLLNNFHYIMLQCCSYSCIIATI